MSKNSVVSGVRYSYLIWGTFSQRLYFKWHPEILKKKKGKRGQRHNTKETWRKYKDSKKSRDAAKKYKILKVRDQNFKTT